MSLPMAADGYELAAQGGFPLIWILQLVPANLASNVLYQETKTGH